MTVNFPDFVESKVVDKDGNLTPIWREIFILLFNQLQINFSNEGVVIPDLTSSQIGMLTNSQPFTLIGNSTANTLQVNIAGVFKTITVS